MIRTMAISVILLIFLALASCGKEKSMIDMNHSFPSTNLSQSSETDEKKSNKPAEDNETQLKAGVIAKSGNAVSSSDKEEVIKQLDKELDSLFDSINESKDVGESDLGQD